jgi:hypothetical protein
MPDLARVGSMGFSTGVEAFDLVAVFPNVAAVRGRMAV